MKYIIISLMLITSILHAQPTHKVESDAYDKNVAIRPLVLPILRGNDLLSSECTWHQMSEVIRIAVAFAYNFEPVKLPNSIETIVLLEQENEWSVAFFIKGNSHVATYRDGKLMNPEFSVSLNPKMVNVDKKTRQASFSDNQIAAPWPIGLPVGIQLRYLDETEPEQNERILREIELSKTKQAEQTGSNSDEGQTTTKKEESPKKSN